jgi:hypothetical protein
MGVHSAGCRRGRESAGHLRHARRCWRPLIATRLEDCRRLLFRERDNGRLIVVDRRPQAFRRILRDPFHVYGKFEKALQVSVGENFSGFLQLARLGEPMRNFRKLFSVESAIPRLVCSARNPSMACSTVTPDVSVHQIPGVPFR